MKFYEKEDILLRSPDGERLERYWPTLGRWVTYADAERAWEETREIDEETAAGVMAEEDGVSREAPRIATDDTHVKGPSRSQDQLRRRVRVAGRAASR
jgi:hypothetical protein